MWLCACVFWLFLGFGKSHFFYPCTALPFIWPLNTTLPQCFLNMFLLWLLICFTIWLLICFTIWLLICFTLWLLIFFTLWPLIFWLLFCLVPFLCCFNWNSLLTLHTLAYLQLYTAWHIILILHFFCDIMTCWFILVEPETSLLIWTNILLILIFFFSNNYMAFWLYCFGYLLLHNGVIHV